MAYLNKIIRKLPLADLELNGAAIHVSQGINHQIVFMEFEEDLLVPEHQHSDQVEFVVKGKVDVTVNGIETTYTEGEQFSISSGTLHSAKVYAGYVSIAFFDEPSRYSTNKRTGD